ncbi:hypothetical protein D4T97_020225 [Siminovitchia acidinfaciens]|uniref:AAA domain-containing protein n=1 Tax=Siminovitchia acidinfaciens TaxID=2321395 RepID=A0A429XSX1_9BACI|nr:AAA family ATPase [Siminovitchia acidinfaciens]RST70320.1 hypothetical protein D4T97_020225 [Siminovitchia acidinfaciens]
MVKIFCIKGNEDWTKNLEETAKDIGCKISWSTNEFKLLERLQKAENTLVLLPHSSEYDVYRLCSKVLEQIPLVTVLLVFESDEQLDMQKALRAGADDVIFLSSPLPQIKDDLHLAVSNSKNKKAMDAKKQGKVITFASTKGGVGKTTAAVNLAAAMGKKFSRTAVIDLDLQFGDVAMICDVKPKKTIYDWVKEDPGGAKIESFMTPFKDGVSILAAPQRPEFAEVITGDFVRKAIHSLRQLFDAVIIDCSSHMDENVIVALENSDEIMVMTYYDLPTLKNSKMLIDTLDSLQLAGKVKVVLNRKRKVKGLSPGVVEKVLGLTAFAELPAKEAIFVNSVNAGNPVIYSSPRSKAAKEFIKMAGMLIHPETSKNPKKQKVKSMVHAGGHV